MVFDSRHDLFNIFFETEVEHLVGLIEDCGFKVGKVEISSLDVVLYTTCGAYKEINPAPQSIRLVVDGDSTVYSEHRIFAFIVLQSSNLFCNLKCKFASWC